MLWMKVQEDLLEQHWQKKETSIFGGVVAVEYRHNRKPTDPLPLRATYRPEARSGEHELLIEFSLPKLVIGNNWEMVWDLPAALHRLDSILPECPALPPLPPSAEIALSRLDICYNHEVGDLLPHYIEALFRLDHARRTVARFNTETVEFRAKSVKTKFYDKHAESQGQAPQGLLRQEITLHRSAAIKRALRTSERVFLGSLTIPRLKEVLDRNLDTLTLSDRCLLTPDLSCQILTDHYGSNRGLRLFGVLTAFQTLGRQELADRLGITRASVSRLLRDIKKAGLSLTQTRQEAPLPPLTIEIPDPIPALPPQICTQVPGVTLGHLGEPEPEGEADEKPQGGADRDHD
jgi:transcriptional regulator with XRE-family HTH domain